MLSVPSMGVRRTALFTFWDSGKRVDSILMTACPEVDFAVRCATTKHTVSATLQFPWQLQKHYILQRLGGDCLFCKLCLQHLSSTTQTEQAVHLQ